MERTELIPSPFLGSYEVSVSVGELVCERAQQASPRLPQGGGCQTQTEAAHAQEQGLRTELQVSRERVCVCVCERERERAE